MPLVDVNGVPLTMPRASWSGRTPSKITGALRQQGMDGSVDLGPGQPLTPRSGYSVTPRANDYPIGVNLATSNREQWGRTSYAVIKGIIDAYDIARMCINHKIDEIRSMEPMFLPADGISGDVDSAIDTARLVMSFPDRENDWNSWVNILLENALRYDSTPLYRRRNMDGEIISFENLDGATIFPYVDENGRRPHAPAPAYFQRIKGLTDVWFTAEDISYNRYRPQADSPYGLAPIESVLLTANTDLKFQWHFLQMFTDGSIPGGFIDMPPDLSSPDQVAEWQDYWDSITLGDQTILHKLIAVPNGTNITETRPKTFDEKFPQYLMSRTAAAFGVVPQDIGVVADVNRANGETQTDIQFRVNTLPWVLWVQGIVNRYLQLDLGLPVKMKLNTGRDKEDRLADVQAWAAGVNVGAVSPDEMRSELYGLPIDNERPVPRGIISSKSGFTPLASMYAIAGPVNPETAAPVESAPLALTPFDGAPGVVPMKAPGATVFTRAPFDPDEPERPALEHPVPGTGVVAPPAPLAKSEGPAAASGGTTVGVTSATGISGADLIEDDDEPDDDELVKSEMRAFTRFTKARKARGVWRDFTFTAVDPATGARLNDAARAELVKGAQLVAAVDANGLGILEDLPDPEDDAAPKGDALAKSWRDSANKVPAHEYDLTITDHYSPLIAAALQALVDQLPIATIADTSLTKSAVDDAFEALVRAKVAQAGANLDTAGLEQILRQILADGYLTGGHAAGIQLGGHAVSIAGVTGDAIVTTDWAGWQPGDTAAALKTADGGLADMLANVGVTLKGITQSVLDQVGNGIADGLTQGLGSDAIARMIRDQVGSTSRAEMIAHTETARAQTGAAFDAYTANNVGQWELLLSDGACPECEAVADANPHPVSDAGDAPPIHPRCRCASTPVIPGA